MAKLAQINQNDSDIDAIQKSQTRLRGLHIKLGKLLKQLAFASKSGNTDIEGFPDGLDQSLLTDLVNVEEIERVNHYRDEVTKEDQSVEAVLNRAVLESGGRLVATSAAVRSAKECTFKEIDRVEICLNLLANEYYSVYATKSIKLEQAIEAGSTYRIEFKGDTAATTRGKFETYRRDYRGRPVDIGKHLGLGNSRNPERCFRLHFHFDEQEGCIVIHHAGKHLPTS